MITRAIVASLVIFLGAGTATLYWSYRTTPCREFEERVVEFAKHLPKKRSGERARAIDEILADACSVKYAACGFQACPQIAARKREGLKSTKKNSVRRRTTTTRPAETNRLAWLDQNLSCSDFLREVKSRYASSRKFAELPPERRQELTVVLSVACSHRFAHCGFPSCKTEGNANGD